MNIFEKLSSFAKKCFSEGSIFHSFITPKFNDLMNVVNFGEYRKGLYIPKINFLSYKLKKSLAIEAFILKEYFDSEEGLKTLLNLYVQAETNMVTEPAGMVDHVAKRFEYFSAPQYKKDYLVSILMEEKKKISQLAFEVEKHIVSLIKVEDNPDFCKDFLEELRAYEREPKNLDTIVVMLEYYLTNHYFSSFQEQGIEVHVHPMKVCSFKKTNGKTKTYYTKKGYSKSDVGASEDKTLGLIEYDRAIHTLFSLPYLVIDFNILHRTQDLENKVETYHMFADEQEIFVKNSENIERKFKTPKIIAPAICAPQIYAQSKFVWPFLDHEKTFDVNEHVYLDKPVSAKRIEVKKSGETKELMISDPNPFAPLFLRFEK